jgi:pimeloyl-ACP methyl ester carboxylesterase
MARHHVVLIPGFFAFAGLGDLRYWTGVDVELAAAFAAFDLEFDITEIESLPTASIRYRASKVVEAIAAVAARDDGPIHLVGHSTGGIDARVAVTPNAALATKTKIDYERVASIVTIATPHRGTPLASLFGSFMGQPILRALASSAIFGIERGGVPLAQLLRLGSLITRIDDLFGLERTLADQLFEQLLHNFDAKRRQALIGFLDNVSKDRALVVQLNPDSMDLFHATTADPDGIVYGSVITRARRPSFPEALVHAYDPYAQGLHLLYCALWTLTARFHERYMPSLSEAQSRALIAGYGELPELSDNDGMAPTLSQVWGEVVHVTEADHLDVMGQYGDLGRSGIHADWLPSGSGFDRARFTALWQAVAGFVTRNARIAE